MIRCNLRTLATALLGFCLGCYSPRYALPAEGPQDASSPAPQKKEFVSSQYIAEFATEESWAAELVIKNPKAASQEKTIDEVDYRLSFKNYEASAIVVQGIIWKNGSTHWMADASFSPEPLHDTWPTAIAVANRQGIFYTGLWDPLTKSSIIGAWELYPGTEWTEEGLQHNLAVRREFTTVCAVADNAIIASMAVAPNPKMVYILVDSLTDKSQEVLVVPERELEGFLLRPTNFLFLLRHAEASVFFDSFRNENFQRARQLRVLHLIPKVGDRAGKEEWDLVLMDNAVWEASMPYYVCVARILADGNLDRDHAQVLSCLGFYDTYEVVEKENR